jgi:two-component system nitrate/nitrite response regulator NarL
MNSPAIRVVLVDDHQLCRRGLADLLERQGDMKVLCSTGDPAQAEAAIREMTPDLIVVDLRMPLMSGLTLLQRARAIGCDAPAVVLTMSDSQDDLANAFRAGVRGYLLKDMDPTDIVECIRRTARGELVVAPAMAVKLANLLQFGAQGQPKDKSVKLTEREREILQYLAGGKSNKEIARSLTISHDTVKLHVRHILAKLNLSSRVEAAVFAVEHGGMHSHSHTESASLL